MSAKDVTQLLEHVEQLPLGLRVRPAEQARALADQLGDEALMGRARLSLVQAYLYGGRPEQMFTPFGWLLQRYDAGAPWFDARTRFELLWRYKWTITNLLDFPAVPLVSIENALTGMADRYAAAGEGPAPMLGCRTQLAVHRFGVAAAEEDYRRWVSAPRTHLSDCLACELSDRAAVLSRAGAHEQAVELTGDVLSGRTTCAEQPQRAIAVTLEGLLRTGRTDQAAAELLRGTRLTRPNPDEMALSATFIHIAARTGQHARGLEQLTARLAELPTAPSPWAAMMLCAAGSRLLAALTADGFAETPVQVRGAEPEPLAVLHDRLVEQALELAGRFDARNGTATVSQLVHGMLTADELPALGRAVPTAAPAPVADPDGADRRWLEGLSVVELSEQVRIRHRRGRRDYERAVRVWAASGTPGRSPADLAATAALDENLLRLRTVRHLGDPVTGREQVTVAGTAQTCREVGDEARAVYVEIFDGYRDIDVLRRTTARLDDLAEAPAHLRARVRMMTAALLDDDSAETAELIGQARALVIDDPDPDARVELARLLLRDLQQRDRSTGAAEAADAIIAMLGADRLDLQAAALVARVVAEQDMAMAEPLLRRALDLAISSQEPASLVHVVLPLAFVLSRRGRELPPGDPQRDELTAEAIRLSRSAVRAADEDGDVQPRARCRLLLAQALTAVGERLEAAETAETAVLLLGPLEEDTDRHRDADLWLSVLDLAAALAADLGGPSRAADLAERAAAVAEHFAMPHQQSEALLTLGDYRGRTDAAAGLAAYDRAAGIARSLGDDRNASVARRERVWLVAQVDGPDAALRAVDEATEAMVDLEQRVRQDDEVAARLGEWSFSAEHLELTHQRVSLLRQAGRPADALALCDGLIDGWRDYGAERNSLLAAMLAGGALLDLGREREATDRLTEVARLAHAGGAPGLAEQAARMLVTPLDEAGRTAEADALWTRLTDPASFR